MADIDDEKELLAQQGRDAWEDLNNQIDREAERRAASDANFEAPYQVEESEELKIEDAKAAEEEKEAVELLAAKSEAPEPAPRPSYYEAPDEGRTQDEEIRDVDVMIGNHRKQTAEDNLRGGQRINAAGVEAREDRLRDEAKRKEQFSDVERINAESNQRAVAAKDDQKGLEQSELSDVERINSQAAEPKAETEKVPEQELSDVERINLEAAQPKPGLEESSENKQVEQSQATAAQNGNQSRSDQSAWDASAAASQVRAVNEQAAAKQRAEQQAVQKAPEPAKGMTR